MRDERKPPKTFGQDLAQDAASAAQESESQAEAEGTATPPVTTDQDTESLTFESSLADPGITELETDADLVAMIDRIKRDHPDALADLVTSSHETDEPLSLWLDGDGVPQRFGKFAIRRQLGQGGFGIVFLAHDPELSRDVALKVPRIESLVTPQVRDRFLREAQAVASLHHRHVATVYESGSVGPICYIASAYYRGGSLADFLSGGEPLSFQQSARIALAIAEGSQHAHSRGILHRDLKPANVLLDVEEDQVGTPNEQNGTDEAVGNSSLDADAIVITDFGLAKFVEELDSNTRTGTVLGSPSYMAPELVNSRPDEVGTTTDIYSIGAILYELLTGRPPHRRDSVLATLNAVRSEEPAAPRSLRADTPRDLQAICLKCLEKEPSRRYQTANELAADLRDWLEGRPVTARPVSARERLFRWCRRHPAQSALAACLLLSVIAVAVVSSVAYLRVSTARAAELEQQRGREKNFQRARRAVDSLLAQVAVEGLEDQPRMEGVRRALLEKALVFYESFQDEKGDEPELLLETARAYESMGQIEYLLGNYNDAEARFQDGLAMCERLADEGHGSAAVNSALAECLRGLATVFSVTPGSGRLEEAEELLERAITIHRKSEPLRRGALAACHLRLAMLHRSQRRLTQSEQQSRAVLRLLELQESGSDALTLAPTLQSYLANAHGMLAHSIVHRDPLQAEAHFQEAISRLRRLTEEHTDDLSYVSALASSLRHFSRFLRATERETDARQHAAEAVKLLERLRLDFPGTPAYRRWLADSHFDLGEAHSKLKTYPQANEHFQQGARLFEKLAAEFPEQSRYSLKHIEGLLKQAKMQFRLKERDSANRLADQAKQILKSTFAEPPGDVGTRLVMVATLQLAGDLEQSLRHFDDAQQYYQQALQVLADTSAADQTDPYFLRLECKLRTALGYFLVLQKRAEEAEEQLHANLVAHRKLLDHYSENPFYQRLMAVAHLNMATPYLMKRKFADADKQYKAALAITEQWDLSGRFAALEGELLVNLYYGLGNFHSLQGRDEEAVEAMKQAIAVADKLDEAVQATSQLRYMSVVSHGNMARSLHHLGRADESLQTHNREYELIVELQKEFPTDPRYLQALGTTSSNLAFLLVVHPDADKRDPQRAIEVCEKALKISRPSTSLWRALGIAQYQNADFAKAQTALSRAAGARPDALVFFYLAMALHQQEDAENAKLWYQRGLQSTAPGLPDFVHRAQSDAAKLLGL